MATLAQPAPARGGVGPNIYLIFIALGWVGIITGFGTDSFRHVSEHGLDYPLIVHVHAVSYLGWLVLFTVQAMLIQQGRGALHRRLGMIGAGLAVWMLIIGPATALVVDATRYAASGRTPEFLAIQLADMVGFAGLIGAALALRRNRAAHQRLMLLATLALTDAGFARFLNDPLPALVPGLVPKTLVGLYFGSDLLILAFGLVDWLRERRLHPAYLAAVLWIAAIQGLAVFLFFNPVWKALSLRMIGA